MSKILLIIWSLLAILNFIFAFWIEPIVFMIAGLTFGSLNIVTIITWIVLYLTMRSNQKTLDKMIKDSNAELEKELEEGVKII